jgi:hypothetical protein
MTDPIPPVPMIAVVITESLLSATVLATGLATNSWEDTAWSDARTEG